MGLRAAVLALAAGVAAGVWLAPRLADRRPERVPAVKSDSFGSSPQTAKPSPGSSPEEGSGTMRGRRLPASLGRERFVIC